MTNADAIRAMTDDELLKFLIRIQDGDIDYTLTFCSICEKDKLYYDCGEDCLKGWLQLDAEKHYQGLRNPRGLNSDCC